MIVARLSRTVDAILEQPATRAWMERKGFEIAGGSAQEFAHILSADDAKWRDSLRRMGIPPE